MRLPLGVLIRKPVHRPQGRNLSKSDGGAVAVAFGAGAAFLVAGFGAVTGASGLISATTGAVALTTGFGAGFACLDTNSGWGFFTDFGAASFLTAALVAGAAFLAGAGFVLVGCLGATTA